MDFKELGLSKTLLQTIDEMGYVSPSPIQEKAIPVILMGRDIVGLAQTGTGKTASFTLPMIEILSSGKAKSRMPRSLILAPTRELAAQVSDNFDKYGKYDKLSKALLVGGESMNDQIKLLEKGVDVLIATPGRLLDLFERGMILLNGVNILVIDEADRMLDMGFIPDIEKIISLLNMNRQTLLFSATMPNEIKKLAEKFLHNPKYVSVDAPASASRNIEQFVIWTYDDCKFEVLEALVEDDDFDSAFIFCNRKKDVDRVAKHLINNGHKAIGWHGDMTQALRNESLRKFKDGEVSFLVCSDVAARGIDIQDVPHVLNFDVPVNPDDYVHRIGRTGRAGAKGDAWLIATVEEAKFVKAIEKNIGSKISVAIIEGIDAPSEEEIEEEIKFDKKINSKSGGAKGSKQARKKADKKHNHKKSANYKKDYDKKDSNNKNYSRKQKEHKKHDDVSQKEVVGFGDDLPAFMASSID